MKQILDWSLNEPVWMVAIGVVAAIALIIFYGWMTTPSCQCRQRINLSEDEIAILDALQRPSEWSVGEHTVGHKSGIEIWTANTYVNFALYKPRMEFREPAKKIIYEAVDKMKRKKIAKQLEGESK